MTVIVSGGFDPLHIGHLNLIKHARAFGRVIVIVDSDEYVSSKHRLGMPQFERMRIVENLKDVDTCIPNSAHDGDCSKLLSCLRPETFVVGPDKNVDELPERWVCQRLGIRILKADCYQKEHSSRDYAKPQYDNPPVCVSVIVRDYFGAVLVGRRTDNGKWDLPGGFVEPRESLEECARREFSEETGGSVGLTNLHYFDSCHSKYSDGRSLLLVAFVADLSGECVKLTPSSEMKEFDWVKDVPENMNNKDDASALTSYFAQQRS